MSWMKSYRHEYALTHVFFACKISGWRMEMDRSARSRFFWANEVVISQSSRASISLANGPGKDAKLRRLGLVASTVGYGGTGRTRKTGHK